MGKQHWWSRRARPAPDPAPAPPSTTEPGTVVLGAQQAAASANEAEHQRTDHGPSPLDGVAYRPEEHDLFHLPHAAADDAVDSVVAPFAAAGPDDRAAVTARLRMEDLYVLVAFARRRAVLALRTGDPAVAARGAEALALVDVERVDWRDLVWAGQLLVYALDRLGADRAALLRRAAALASGGTAEALAELAEEDGLDLVDLGYREVLGPEGVGLLEDGGDDYEPDADLVGVGLAVAAALRGDAWQLDPPEVGASVAPVWLRDQPAAAVDEALGEVTGCASLHGRLDPSVPDAGAQHLLIVVLEARTPGSAEVLGAAAGPGERGDFVAVSAVLGRVCAIAISRSVVMGVPAIETAESILRFGPLFDRALADAS